MPPTTRASSVLDTATPTVNVWIDYDAKKLIATALTIENTGGDAVFAAVTTSKGATLGQSFGPGVTSLAIPSNAGVGVGFDPNDATTPFLTGVDAIAFRDPA